ncbi:MAG: HAD family phosphatase [Fibrobacteria bacterium]|nr:HAD family phosphatase [Fibrobacteria bacterium]
MDPIAPLANPEEALLSRIDEGKERLPRALVFDLDDTLLSRTKEISPRTLSCLHRVLDSGIVVCLATSRPIRSVRHFVPEALLDRLAMITLNGAVSWTSGVERRHSCVSSDLPEILERCAREPDLILTLEWEGEEFATNLAGSRVEGYQNPSKAGFLRIEEASLEGVSKLAIDGNGRPLQILAADLRRGSLSVIPALGGTFLNVVQARVDKATTLSLVLRERMIAWQDTAVFGDDTPDLGMLARAGRPVAMGNSCPEVLSACRETIGDCDSDAIASWIDRTFPPPHPRS